MSMTLASAFVPRVIIYGDTMTDVKLGGIGTRGAATHVVIVRAFRFLDKCTRLPNPIWVPVYAPGVDVAEGECGFHQGEVEKWEIDGNELGISLSPSSGNMLDLLEEASILGLSGGVDIENIRFGGGQVCADLVAWAKIKLAGREKKFDERIGICVGLGGGCATKDINSWAKVELCYNLPSEICAKLSVNIWGYSDSWKKCAGVYVTNACLQPASPTEPSSGNSCGCKS